MDGDECAGNISIPNEERETRKKSLEENPPETKSYFDLLLFLLSCTRTAVLAITAAVAANAHRSAARNGATVAVERA